ncbi:AMP-binding protein [Nakamurella leprariae]|uniref:AMP-binding protein n=1 Tax=Nakamurella leprariae TaxID=2803911 RepID=A0A938YDG2_9ACTN|nr:AMP-binding protein [Nakamurella leprariae]MBM9467809.1 AMP-binding protein [Nakamurella leprariae]
MTEAFVRCGPRHRPLTEVQDRAVRFAGALQGLGVGHGDRYAIVMRNEIAYVETTIGASSIGAVPVPVNWHWTGTDLRHILTDSGAKVAVVHSDLVPAVEAQAPEGLVIIEAAVPSEVSNAYALGHVPVTGRHPLLTDLITASAPATATVHAPPISVIYTSGTTGRPKGILRNPIAAAAMPDTLREFSQSMGIRPGGTTLIPAPLYHAAPNVGMSFAAAIGANIVIMPRFDAEGFLALVQEFRVETVQMVPTMFVRLLKLPEQVRRAADVSSLKTVVTAAASCPPDVKRAMIDWLGPIVSEYYGGAETGVLVECTAQEWLAHPGTVGRPVRGAAIKILDADRREVPVGEVGLVYGRPTTTWPDFTYLNDDAGRREVDDGTGFITVGDVGRVDDDGFLYLSDRLKDMIVSGGVNIYPAEIEAAIVQLAGVRDAAVFGIPDPDMGEAIAVHIELEPGAVITEEDVRAHVRSTLARYKVPKVVVFDDALPREDTGKLFKRMIKDHYWSAAGNG